MNARWILVALLLLAPTAAAAGEGLQIVAPTDDIYAKPLEPTTWEVHLEGYLSDQSHRVVANLNVPEGNWLVRITPQEVILPPGGTQTFVVEVEAPRSASPRLLEVELTLTAIQGSEYRIFEANQTFQSTTSNLVLGRWENPLPDPFHGQPYTFILNILAWVAIATAFRMLLTPLMHRLTKNTETDVDDRLTLTLGRPIFTLIVAYGARQSLESLDLPYAALRTIDVAWILVLVSTVTLATYRLWGTIILGIGHKMAKRTESQLDDRLYPLFEKVGGIVLLLIGVFYGLGALNVNTTFFAAGGAIVSLVIAFAAQETLGNFFSGIFLLLDQPFSEGDDIRLESGEVCRVEHIGLRSTRLYYRAHHEYMIMPNSNLANAPIVNLLRPDHDYKVMIPVGVAYGSDVAKVEEILLRVARTHPLVLQGNPDRDCWVWFMDFGESSLDFRLYCWVTDVYQRFQVASDLRRAIDFEFRNAGIEIPFPQRDVWMREADAVEPAVPIQKPVMSTEEDLPHGADDGLRDASD